MLPALPDDWHTGTFKGVCARGAFELDYTWENKRVTALKIISKAGGICRLEGKAGVKVSCNGKLVKINVLGNGNVELETVKGGVYVVE